MSRKSTAFLSFALMLFFSGVSAFAFAQERIPVGHHCVEDDQGNIICSKHSGGDAFEDRTNKRVVCGKGHCQVDYYKNAMISCAKTEDGVAAYDRQGKVVCSGGCEPAAPEMCEKLKP